MRYAQSTEITLSRRKKPRPLSKLIKMFKNRKKSKQDSFNNNTATLTMSSRFSRRGRSNKLEEQQHEQQFVPKAPTTTPPTKKHTSKPKPPESPPRKMPHEIKILPGTPDSSFSTVSGATGLPPDHYERNLSAGKSMFKSFLPEMNSTNSDTEECSLDRSIFNWTSFPAASGVTGASSGSHSQSQSSSSRATPWNRTSDNKSPLFGGSANSYGSAMPQSKRDLFLKKKKPKSKPKKGSIMTRSKTFQNLVNYTFDTIDSDKSGTIDKKELYTGLILIHLNLAAYVGPAACSPASKEYVDQMFDMLDKDRNGSLNKEEFTVLMSILCSQITTRVFIQLSMTILIVPFISEYFVDFMKDSYRVFWVILAQIDEKEDMSEFVMKMMKYGWDGVLLLTPPILQTFISSVYDALSEGYMDGMPLTIMSCVLGCMIVPWILFKCDEFYNGIALKRSKRGREHTQVKRF